MSIFRKNRLTEDQLRDLLGSLPQVKAPEDFDGQLDRMIELHSEHVPHMLGSLPMVPAPDDFDARLMEAIRDNRRRVAPLPVPIAAGGASINWLNHIMGWLGGSLAVVALAFFINQPSETPAPVVAPQAPTVAQEKAAVENAPERISRTSSGSVGAPYGVTMSQTTTLASAAYAVDPEPAETTEPAIMAEAEAIEQIAGTPEVSAPASQIHRHSLPSATVPSQGAVQLTTEIGSVPSSTTRTSTSTAPQRDPALHEVMPPDAGPAQQSGPAVDSEETDTVTAPSNEVINTGGDREKKEGFKTKNP